MPPRNTVSADPDETAKLAALREAARIGLDDLEHGRYCEIDDSELDAFIRELGRVASKQRRNAKR